MVSEGRKSLHIGPFTGVGLEWSVMKGQVYKSYVVIALFVLPGVLCICCRLSLGAQTGTV